MSLFGQSTGQQGGGLFGGQQNKPLFGSLNQNAQQNNTQQQPQNTQTCSLGLYGHPGQNTQQNQPQQSTGLFGGLGQNNQQNQQQSVGLFSNLGNPQNQQQPGGIFSQSTVKNLPQLGQSQLGASNNGLGGSLWQPGSAVKPRKLILNMKYATC
jgi:nuclear pore complex protein Nup54